MLPLGIYQMLTAEEERLMSLHALMDQTPDLLFLLSLGCTAINQEYISSLIAS